ncbi:MAG TPA: response regulator [Elusimicrobiota bacterium]|nr:response regulator [Elusimicrobiota bacterium]
MTATAAFGAMTNPRSRKKGPFLIYMPTIERNHPSLYAEQRAMPHKPFVLLVEDNPDDVNLTMIAFKSNRFPYEVEVACDGADALGFLRGKSPGNLPALILLDINMPRVSGLEFLEQIRSDARLSNLTVSILTSSSQESDKVRARELGVVDYIIKPVDLSEFDVVVRRISRLMEEVLHHRVG